MKRMQTSQNVGQYRADGKQAHHHPIFATEAPYGGTVSCYPDSDGLADPADAGAYHFVLRETEDDRAILGRARLHVWPGIPESAITLLNLGSFAAAYRHPFGYVSQLAVAAGPSRVDYGLSLIKAVVEFSHWPPIDAEIIFSHCAPELAPLYQAFGLRPFGEAFDAPDVGPQVPLYIIGGDVECHEKTGSLLVKTAHRFRIPDGRLDALNRYLALVGPCARRTAGG